VVRVRWLLLGALAVLLLLDAPPLLGRSEAAIPPPCTRRLSTNANIYRVLSQVQPGSIVCLSEGTFHGRLVMDQWTSPGIVLRGAGPGRTILDGGGASDALLILDQAYITIEDLTLRGGEPANAYVARSYFIAFQNVEVTGGGIGIHIDQGSVSGIAGSHIHHVGNDGVLIRQGSGARVGESVVEGNGGVGVSAVGHVRRAIIDGNQIRNNGGPGVFAGQTPCALLPPGEVGAPSCYLANLGAYVGEATVELDRNVISGNVSTGVVFFPGTTGVMRYNTVTSNLLTGLFVWGATVDAYSNLFQWNEEHGLEYRAYPDPLHFGSLPAPYPLRARGIISGNTIRETTRLGSILGGGLLSQGADLSIVSNQVVLNAGIGISFVNGAIGRVVSNFVVNNGGSAICLFRAGSVSMGANNLGLNLADQPGVCDERFI
jgi:hypothetical protein